MKIWSGFTTIEQGQYFYIVYIDIHIKHMATEWVNQV